MIGLAVVTQLLDAGFQVAGLEIKTSAALRSLAQKYRTLRLMDGDLLDPAFVVEAFKNLAEQKEVSAVIHLAGLADASQCEADPIRAFEQNTMATVCVLEACCRAKIRHLIFPSTGYVYGTGHSPGVKESCDSNPQGLYALTKLAAETVIRGYASMGRIGCDILRLSNVYGPASKPNTVVGLLLSQKKDHLPISVHDPAPIRDFVHVDDVVETMFRLIQAGPSGPCTLNVSTGIGTSTGELARLFAEVQHLPHDNPPSSVGERAVSSCLVMDNAGLHQRLQWRPGITLREGLSRL
jgi:UDP-glucose 4-epimerase